mmetsp:Transcript_29710/g.50194  ORF Transcript_29710/g.50194 Transcript_29710/m.50194 type:complete len:573 (+) Transcript_29710:57-1775(+)
MSITLEGKVTIPDVVGDDKRVDTAGIDSEDATWNGLWRFTKEKKSFLDFRYQQKGLAVPRALYDYVSFKNEPPASSTTSGSSGSANKKSGSKSKVGKNNRGRGRPPVAQATGAPTVSSAPADDAVPATIVPTSSNEHSDTNLDRTGNESATMVESSSNSAAISDGVEVYDAHAPDEVEVAASVEVAVSDAIGTGTGGTPSSAHVDSSSCETVAVDTTAGTSDQFSSLSGVGDASKAVSSVTSSTSSSATGSSDSQSPVMLEKSHPLIGMWEGTFNVKAGQGEEAVAETFFIYAVQGSKDLATSTTRSNSFDASSSGAAAAGAAAAGGPIPLADRPEHLLDLPPDPSFPYVLLPALGIDLGATANSTSTIRTTTTSTTTTTTTTSDTSKKLPLDEGVESATGSTKETIAATSIVEPPPSAVADNVASTLVTSTVGTGTDATTTSSGVSSTGGGGGGIRNPISVLPPEFLVVLGFGRNSFGRFSVAGVYDQTTGELKCEKKYMVMKYSAKRGRRSYAECAATGTLLPSSSSAAGAGGHASSAVPPVPPSTRQRFAPNNSSSSSSGGGGGGVDGR